MLLSSLSAWLGHRIIVRFELSAPRAERMPAVVIDANPCG